MRLSPFVEEAISDTSQPVVMFALEWCEFCWSVRKLLTEFGIPYRSIDLDSVAYQKDNRGGDIRAALRAEDRLTDDPADLRWRRIHRRLHRNLRCVQPGALPEAARGQRRRVRPQ